MHFLTDNDSPDRIDLTHAEVLVLFEFLSREQKRKQELDGRYDTLHEEEQLVLWSIVAQLEKRLVEPLDRDYSAIQERARQAVHDAAYGAPEAPPSN